MPRPSFTSGLLGLLLALTTVVCSPLQDSWGEEFGGTEPGTWVLGTRVGFSPLTQQLADNTSTSIGPMVNFQALYSINRWFLVGLMVEWERHTVSLERPDLDLGHQDTVSVLPTMELRPVKFDRITPYVNMSFGVNVNSFGEETTVRISPSNTFAWRLEMGSGLPIESTVCPEHRMGLQAK